MMELLLLAHLPKDMSEPELMHRLSAEMQADPYLGKVSTSWAVGWKPGLVRVEIQTRPWLEIAKEATKK